MSVGLVSSVATPPDEHSCLLGECRMRKSLLLRKDFLEANRRRSNASMVQEISVYLCRFCSTISPFIKEFVVSLIILAVIHAEVLATKSHENSNRRIIQLAESARTELEIDLV
jgi:hypothetical protein